MITFKYYNAIVVTIISDSMASRYYIGLEIIAYYVHAHK